VKQAHTGEGSKPEAAIRVMRQKAMHFNTFHYKNKQQGKKTKFIHTNHEEI